MPTRDGGFLVLTVRPSRMRWAEDGAIRRFESGAGYRSTICCLMCCGTRPRNWKSIGPSSNMPMVPSTPVRIGRT